MAALGRSFGEVVAWMGAGERPANGGRRGAGVGWRSKKGESSEVREAADLILESGGSCGRSVVFHCDSSGSIPLIKITNVPLAGLHGNSSGSTPLIKIL
jgi:hypothetical protein